MAFLSGALDCLRAIDEAEFVPDSFDFDETLFRRDIVSFYSLVRVNTV